MGFHPAALCPVVCVIVVADVAQQQAGVIAVHDQADVAGHANRPEVLVFGLIQLVEAQARMGRVQLQVKGGHLRGLLFVAGQACEAARKCVGYTEFHASPLYPEDLHHFVAKVIDDLHGNAS